MKKLNKALSGLLCLGLVQGAMADGATQLLFGDTHLHTSYSFDAYLNKNQTADPDTAYRWAKGLPVIHLSTAPGYRLKRLWTFWWYLTTPN